MFTETEEIKVLKVCFSKKFDPFLKLSVAVCKLYSCTNRFISGPNVPLLVIQFLNYFYSVPLQAIRSSKIELSDPNANYNI